jgi:hypothetical protein
LGIVNGVVLSFGCKKLDFLERSGEVVLGSEGFFFPCCGRRVVFIIVFGEESKVLKVRVVVWIMVFIVSGVGVVEVFVFEIRIRKLLTNIWRNFGRYNCGNWGFGDIFFLILGDLLFTLFILFTFLHRFYSVKRNAEEGPQTVQNVNIVMDECLFNAGVDEFGGWDIDIGLKKVKIMGNWGNILREN